MCPRGHFEKVRKRDGSLVPFDRERIQQAIGRALRASGLADGGVAGGLATKVAAVAEERLPRKYPSVEQIQDIVEEVLIREGYAQAAKKYILYRQQRAQLREAKKLIGVEDELKLSVNAIRVLERRYLRRDEEGRIVETPMGMFRRVAAAVAKPELNYASSSDASRWEEEFLRVMSSLKFIPNSPTLMNAGARRGQLSACFVIPVEDSMKGIFRALREMALIHQTGGGTGFSFSRLRPKGDIVGSTKGVASGPVSFMHIFDTATEVVKQGGRRRGANMGILRLDHPDILEFITAKTKEGFLRNFNISVAATDRFMRALSAGRDYPLINPRTGKETGRLSAKSVFDLIVTAAWKAGDPGIVFIDRINRHNPTPELGRIESTNPCGELPLLPYESCNLGSINLARMIEKEKVDWRELKETVRVGVRFLDNVIDANRYTISEIKRMTLGNRKIGLGVMGFADMLFRLGIPYDSEVAVALGRRVMRKVHEEAKAASAALAAERGVFPNWEKSRYARRNLRLRNATVTTVAPTGTISIIANCSSSIEPVFALSFVRNVMEGARLLEVNPHFEEVARRGGFYTSELMMEIAKRGSARGLRSVPKDVQRLFVTAFDVSPEWHVRMQAAFQESCDNSVSKTVNLPQNATVDDVRKVFLLAYRLKCKGVTIYRYGTRKQQVLQLASPSAGLEVPEAAQPVSADLEYSGGCPHPQCVF
jgi:ribonucleoside-diphosphate reductase alpha chain